MSGGNFNSQSAVIGRANPPLWLNGSIRPMLTLDFDGSNSSTTTGLIKIPSYSPVKQESVLSSGTLSPTPGKIYSPVIPPIGSLVNDQTPKVRPLTPTITLTSNTRPITPPINLSLTPTSPKSSLDESVVTLKSLDDLSTVDQDLRKLGFSVIGKIVTDENDEKVIRFVRIGTKDGFQGIMELDVERVSLIRENQPMMKRIEKSDISHSVKQGALKCIDGNVCGVAVECNQQICIMRKMGNKNEEANFKLDFDSSEKQTANIMYLPLVTFSEISHSPNKMSDYIAKSYMKLNKTSTQISLSKMISHIKTIDDQRTKLINMLKGLDDKFFQNNEEVQTLLEARETLENWIKNDHQVEMANSKLPMIKSQIRERLQTNSGLQKTITQINAGLAEVSSELAKILGSSEKI